MIKRYILGSTNALKYQGKALKISKRLYSSAPISSGSSNSKFFAGLFAGGIVAGAAMYLKLDSEIDVNKDSSTITLESVRSPKYCDEKSEQFNLAVLEIKKILEDDSECWSTSKDELLAHSDSYFNTHHPLPNQRPNIIFYPKTTKQVSEILKICHDNFIPVVPCSGMSSLEGHLIPTRQGVSIDFSKFMNQIIKLDKKNLDCQVQAGVRWEDLNDFLNTEGLLLGVDPGPNAMIGGMVANSCSGTKAFRYGTMKENVINLTVVLADGTIVKTRRRPKKSSAGYNLNGLFIGSEGTLGVVTEATVKCHVLPKFETIAVIPFKNVRDAAECVTEIVTDGIILNAMELMDNNMMKIINESGQTERTWIEEPTLFFKIGGQSEKEINSVIDTCKKIAKSHRSLGFEFSKTEEEKFELWSARKVALWSTIDAAKKINRDSNVWTTDVIVPISNFPEFMDLTKKDADSSGLISSMVSHCGEGNSHFFYCYSKEQKPIVENLVHKMIKRAIAMDGSASGEHGCGIGKRDYLLEELGPDPVDFMRKIKFAADPHLILNPDKIFRIDPNEPAHD